MSERCDVDRCGERCDVDRCGRCRRAMRRGGRLPRLPIRIRGRNGARGQMDGRFLLRLPPRYTGRCLVCRGEVDREGFCVACDC